MSSQGSQDSSLSDKSKAPPKKHRLVDMLDGPAQKRVKSSMLNEFLKAARWLGRSNDPFINFALVFDIGIEGEGLNLGKKSKHAEVTGYDHYMCIYALLKSSITGFTHHMAPFKEHGDKLNSLTQAMTKALGTARSEDCSSLRDVGLNYVAMDLPAHRLDPQISPHADKGSNRGFKHPDLARLLCPMWMLPEFDDNPAEMMLKLESGDVAVESEDFPSFMYARETEYDSRNLQQGLCRGPLLVKVWKHIFTSPSSATRTAPGPGRTKGCQAKINGLKEVTGRSIAYAALQARWLMCAQDDWRAEDGVFNKEVFFETIVLLFEHDPNDIWCTETLKWWNKAVFKPPAAPILSTQRERPSDILTLLAQRQIQKNKGGHSQLPTTSNTPKATTPLQTTPSPTLSYIALPSTNQQSPTTRLPASPPPQPHAISIPARHSRKSPSPASGSQPPRPAYDSTARCQAIETDVVESDGESELSPPPTSPPQSSPPQTAKAKGKAKAKSAATKSRKKK